MGHAELEPAVLKEWSLVEPQTTKLILRHMKIAAGAVILCGSFQYCYLCSVFSLDVNVVPPVTGSMEILSCESDELFDAHRTGFIFSHFVAPSPVTALCL